MTKSGWYYDKRELKQTPSIIAGLTFEQETVYRREGARFIIQVGNKMGLRYETMATGVVYFHRFYMVHAFQEFPRHVTACCCLFLAGKVEETPKKCRDIMKTAKSLMDEITWAEFGTDPREEVMTLERILLQTIKFDFIVEHPYSYLLKYAKGLKGDKKKLPNMVQMAWTFVNDSLCTTLCLQWEPEIIAIALMYLAGKLSKFDVTDWIGRTPKQEKWWEMYVSGITTELLEDICHQVLDLYSPNRGEGGSGLGPGSVSASSKIASLTSSKNASSSSSKIASSNLPAAVVTNSASVSGSTSSTVSGTTPIAGSSSNSNNVEPSLTLPASSSQKRAVTPTKAGVSQPPAKKAKKEEVKSSPAKPSPAKQEPANPPQSYPYSYPSYSNYPPSYPPSQSSSSGSSSSTAPRYPPYTYPATTTQGPPPPAQVPPQVPPPSYQPPQRHYPPPTATTPQAPPHYTNQPPPSHYSSSSHPSYHPPPTTSHYAAPPPTNYPPPSHGSSSSYYPPPPSTSNPPPSYPQTAPSSSYPPPSSYSHSHPHSSSRSYYPPP